MIESLFYAWRITGEEKWRNMAWQAFEAMQKYLATPRGWVGLMDVNNPSSAFYDEMQTFLLAETFKYLVRISSSCPLIALTDALHLMHSI